MSDPSDDLEAIIGELDAAMTAVSQGDDGPIEEWLREVVRRKGSDLLLVAASPPAIRVDGRLQSIGEETLDGEEIETMVLPYLPAHAVRQYRETGIADASLRVSALGRFRVNLHTSAVARQRPSGCCRPTSARSQS